MIHDFRFSLILYCCKQCEEWKEETFLWSAPGDINIATSLQKSMRWNITSLVRFKV